MAVYTDENMRDGSPTARPPMPDTPSQSEVERVADLELALNLAGRDGAVEKRSYPAWFNAISALSLLLLAISPLAIFWSTRAAVLTTLLAMIAISMLAGAGPVLRRGQDV